MARRSGKIEFTNEVSWQMATNPQNRMAGTVYKGQFDMPYRLIVNRIGKPNGWGGGASPDNKVDAEWVIEFDDGAVVTIYNYKDGPAYTGEGEVDYLTNWHVGGNRKSMNICSRVAAILGVEVEVSPR
jgi:hypothetical protein